MCDAKAGETTRWRKALALFQFSHNVNKFVWFSAGLSLGERSFVIYLVMSTSVQRAPQISHRSCFDRTASTGWISSGFLSAGKHNNLLEKTAQCWQRRTRPRQGAPCWNGLKRKSCLPSLHVYFFFRISIFPSTPQSEGKACFSWIESLLALFNSHQVKRVIETSRERTTAKQGSYAQHESPWFSGTLDAATHT